MNNTLMNINLKSTWFESTPKKESKISLIGYEAFNLYLHLFKFRIARQEIEYTFLTNISLLRKVTGYKTEKIVMLLKDLKSNKIIKMSNLSRWDYLTLENGKCDINRLLLIEGIDSPETSTDDEERDNWVTVDLDFLHSYYPECGLNEKYYPVYCLLRKLSTGHIERKSYMTIENMSKIIGCSKDTLNKMIHAMNEAKVLNSKKKSNGKNGYMFEHYLCYGHKYLDDFMDTHFS